MKLTVNIATRGRPELLKKTTEAYLKGMVLDNTALMISADEDDHETIDSLSKLPHDIRLKFSVRPREDSRGEKYDRALKEHPADVYLPAVDSVPILTEGWDKIILDYAKLFEDGIGVVNTPMANASFPGLQAPTAKLVEKLGWIYNHEYPFWFIDHELDDIARMIGRFVFAPVKCLQHEWRPGNTTRLRDLEFWTTYYDMMNIERRATARRIINGDDFKSPEWLKEVLRNSYQVVEARSLNINAGVRRSAKEIEAGRGDKGPPDEGYLRAKAKAEKKLAQLLRTLKAA